MERRHFGMKEENDEEVHFSRAACSCAGDVVFD